MELQDDDYSRSSSPSVKDPMEVVLLNTAPPAGAGNASEFGGIFDFYSLVSDEGEETR